MTSKKSKGPSHNPPAASPIDLESVTRVLDFMNEHGLEEFEFEASGLRLRLKKAAQNSGAILARAVAVPDSGVPPVASAPASAPAPASSAASAAAQPVEDLHVVKSPIVGTYYEAARPDAPPFVKVGDTVKQGQVLCIVEAMKLMNEIESDAAGVVVRAFVENGHPVEYGESLFAIRPVK
jgi:acetyl-CoA carboxylase biotin carboxyl carrier protein